MATLKSIKNKYLVRSDGEALGVSVNTEAISLLSMKLASADSLSVYNMVDGFTDDFQDTSGVGADSTAATRTADDGGYYKGTVDNNPTGGTVTTYTASGVTYRVHTFNSTSSLVGTSAGNVDVLLVAGGGSGGHTWAGGGGAGGLVYRPGMPISNATYPVSIGAGGTITGSGGTQQNLGGGDTTGFGLTAKGGGSGGTTLGGPSPRHGGSGGSGGGASSNVPSPWPRTNTGGSATQPTQPGESGTYGFGSAGGAAVRPGSSQTMAGAGGGGAGAAGTTTHATPLPSTQDSTAGGHGGAGRAYTIKDGTSIYYAGGGGGAPSGMSGGDAPYDPGPGFKPGGNGGAGGGGSGYPTTGTTNPQMVGAANTGGAGGGGWQGSFGGVGGSGVAIVRYPDTTFVAAANLTLLSNPFPAAAEPTEARIVIDELSLEPTTLNTDITAEVSRDGGTTYSPASLASQGFINTNQGIDTYTKLMLHCNGANDGTAITDNSFGAHTCTAVGNTHTDTTTKKFGTAALQFDGTGDYVTIAAHTDFQFGTGNLTIDFWIYQTVTGTLQKFFGDMNSAGNNSAWSFNIGTNNTVNFDGGTGNSISLATGALTANTWTHIAVVRNGNVWTIYKNGVSAATTTVSATLAALQASYLGIGRQGDNTDNYFTGFLDEIRISKGIARWTANFSVPVFPYETERRLLTGTADFTGDPTGTSMKYRIKTLNTKDVRMYGASLTWG